MTDNVTVPVATGLFYTVITVAGLTTGVIDSIGTLGAFTILPAVGFGLALKKYLQK